MAINQREIIAELRAHVQRSGGEFGAWCVGTAKDAGAPFLVSHQVAEKNDGLTYREAFTPESAQAARDKLVKECGLSPSPEEAVEPGRIVFVYRKTPLACPESAPQRLPFRKLAG